MSFRRRGLNMTPSHERTAVNDPPRTHSASEDVLRMLAVGHLDPDSPAWAAVAAHAPSPDPKLRTIARLGALVATNASDASFAAIVDDAIGAGVTVDDLVGTLLCLAPVIGSARVVSAAPAMATAFGLDVELLLEGKDQQQPISP